MPLTVAWPSTFFIIHKREIILNIGASYKITCYFKLALTIFDVIILIAINDDLFNVQQDKTTLLIYLLSSVTSV